MVCWITRGETLAELKPLKISKTLAEPSTRGLTHPVSIFSLSQTPVAQYMSDVSVNTNVKIHHTLLYQQHQGP